MLRHSERYLPTTIVECTQGDDATVLDATETAEQLSLSATGPEVWTLPQAERVAGEA